MGLPVLNKGLTMKNILRGTPTEVAGYDLRGLNTRCRYILLNCCQAKYQELLDILLDQDTNFLNYNIYNNLNNLFIKLDTPEKIMFQWNVIWYNQRGVVYKEMLFFNHQKLKGYKNE